MSQRLRIACVQWRFDRVASFEQWAGRFAEQVRIAADYRARFVVFPEYVTAELLSTQPLRLDGPASIAHSNRNDRGRRSGLRRVAARARPAPCKTATIAASMCTNPVGKRRNAAPHAATRARPDSHPPAP